MTIADQSSDTTDRASVLQAQLALVNGQRLADLDRLRRLSQLCDQLQFELAERDAELAGLATSATLAAGPPATAEPFQLLPAAVRAQLRKESPAPASLATRIASSLVLRFARAAAARRDYAKAEAFYQVIALLTPRAFAWRQLGNMLAGQGLFAAAVESLEQAIKIDDQDAEAWHAKAMSLKKLDQPEEASAALTRALVLDPALAARGN